MKVLKMAKKEVTKKAMMPASVPVIKLATNKDTLQQKSTNTLAVLVKAVVLRVVFFAKDKDVSTARIQVYELAPYAIVEVLYSTNYF